MLEEASPNNGAFKFLPSCGSCASAKSLIILRADFPSSVDSLNMRATNAATGHESMRGSNASNMRALNESFAKASRLTTALASRLSLSSSEPSAMGSKIQKQKCRSDDVLSFLFPCADKRPQHVLRKVV